MSSEDVTCEMQYQLCNCIMNREMIDHALEFIHLSIMITDQTCIVKLKHFNMGMSDESLSQIRS